MKTTLILKTNINCNGCKSTVTPVLNQAQGICDWDVDLENENKILSIHSDGISSEEVIQMLEKIGFIAEEIKNA